MGRKIIVISNCQTGGIAAALTAILNKDTIIPVPINKVGDSNLQLKEELRSAGACISIGKFQYLSKHDTKAKLVKIPAISFRGFHPDMCYSFVNKKDKLTYASAIAVWAYRNGLSISDAKNLYSKNVFRDLGYFYIWDKSVALLQKRFQGTDIDFNSVFLPIKRSGVFMHTFNHPYISVLVQLAKLIAVNLGEKKSVLRSEMTLGNDALSGHTWPIYPDVGYELALEGEYLWRISGRYISGLESFLENAFSFYQTICSSRLDLNATVGAGSPLYDKVLGPIAGVKK